MAVSPVAWAAVMRLVSTRSAGGVAVHWALAQVGTPYVWGGETPGVGFDCFGLVQPRTAQEQYDAGPQLPPGVPLLPGDLVFFGASTDDVTHVGVYVGMDGGRAVMVDAPHAGADVRVEQIPISPGSAWGRDVVVGASPGRQLDRSDRTVGRSGTWAT